MAKLSIIDNDNYRYINTNHVQAIVGLLEKKYASIILLTQLCYHNCVSDCTIYVDSQISGSHSLARQSCPAALPGSLAQQPCPAALPGSLARQPCPAAYHLLPSVFYRLSCAPIILLLSVLVLPRISDRHFRPGSGFLTRISIADF
jgi:hypothetical protein